LCLQNLRDAQVSLNTFIELLCSGNNVPPHSKVEGIEIFPSLPHVNFLSLLIVACQRGAAEFFISLKKQYSQRLDEVPWNDVPPTSSGMLI
jgi:golgi to ER traffic protein 4